MPFLGLQTLQTCSSKLLPYCLISKSPERPKIDYMTAYNSRCHATGKVNCLGSPRVAGATEATLALGSVLTSLVYTRDYNKEGLVEVLFENNLTKSK
ncbi:hypothetical protein M9H77_23851 [Catharanthus roseus]|uniref:Uncharacterized protein n=1 Tax=Catharanthus roseus TaxID=4058 RepID=A0ACC0AU66_CATRO|nr:hypothetical protein M9H77_23851 [Catharanthus roseus]